MEVVKGLPSLVYRGAREVAGAVGINWKAVGKFVEEEGMPAFKMGGNWVAIPDELEEWLRQQSRKRREY